MYQRWITHCKVARWLRESKRGQPSCRKSSRRRFMAGSQHNCRERIHRNGNTPAAAFAHWSKRHWYIVTTRTHGLQEVVARPSQLSKRRNENIAFTHPVLPTLLTIRRKHFNGTPTLYSLQTDLRAPSCPSDPETLSSHPLGIRLRQQGEWSTAVYCSKSTLYSSSFVLQNTRQT